MYEYCVQVGMVYRSMIPSSNNRSHNTLPYSMRVAETCIEQAQHFFDAGGVLFSHGGLLAAPLGHPRTGLH